MLIDALTPTSAVAKSDGFLCDNERQRMTQKNDAFGNPLDVFVRHFVTLGILNVLPAFFCQQ